LHDAIAVENLGVPAVGVMTTKFVDAADLMARALGAENYKFAIIEHPISSASDGALEEQARAAIKAGMEIVVS
jgi:hypothetical protein